MIAEIRERKLNEMITAIRTGVQTCFSGRLDEPVDAEELLILMDALKVIQLKTGFALASITLKKHFEGRDG